MAVLDVSPKLKATAFLSLKRLLPESLRLALDGLGEADACEIEEIRLALDRPIMVKRRDGDGFVGPRGVTGRMDQAFTADARMIADMLDAVTGSSVYAVEEAMREGCLSLPGGHRVGLLGELKVEGGRSLGFKRVTGFNIRVNRPVIGAARRVLPSLMRPGGTIGSTLIVSPPGCGKTTLLRDLIRSLSYGEPQFGLRPHRVGVADERGEIAGSVRGLPQNDLGPRADVIDRSPKGIALSMLVRTMGPDVVATDEIGHADDAEAILEAAGAGVAVVCTAHGSDPKDLSARPSLRPLFVEGIFSRIVLLGRGEGPGTVERIVEGGRP